MRFRVALGFLLGFCPLAAAPAPAPLGAIAPGAIRVLSDRPLPDSIRAAMDVRWASDDSVFIAAAKAGVFEVPLAFGSTASLRTVIPGGNGSGQFWLSSRLGVSSQFMVVAAPLFTLSWRSREPIGASGESAFEGIVDLDVSGDRLLVLGAQKDERQRFSPDGAIAWVGSLSSSLRDLRAVHYSPAGPGAEPMDACGLFEMGAVRFLPNGTFLVVPGVEPGAYLYDRAAKLVRTWDTAQIGMDTDCKLSLLEKSLLSAKPEPRFAWLNQRRILDEILPLPDGPGLIVRTVEHGTTHWKLQQLKKNGTVVSSDLPIPSTTALSHLRGDLRGRKLALLVSERGAHGPTTSPRLIIAEIQQ